MILFLSIILIVIGIVASYKTKQKRVVTTLLSIIALAIIIISYSYDINIADRILLRIGFYR